ncbi:MAG TPA: ATP-binding protein [Anaeromyxobacter sp.]|nr:ATP-binding protein [Anaeromyxobacter sp.]
MRGTEPDPAPQGRPSRLAPLAVFLAVFLAVAAALAAAAALSYAALVVALALAAVAGAVLWRRGEARAAERARTAADAERRAAEALRASEANVSEKEHLEARLVVADRMASLGTLAAGVAHEINNPLAFILSNLEFALGELHEPDADPELRRALQDALDGAVRVRDIVRHLRTFSRRDDDRRVILDLRPVLQSAVAVATNELRHRAELQVELGDVPPVLASEHRLGQVFLNLLVNAMQAIPDGRPAANRVRVRTATAPDGRAVVEVSDTGAGIPADALPRICDPFFTTKPVGVGTGLGLSVCHGIVAQLGGEIAVESAPGVGTTFRVFLPPASDERRHAPARTAPTRPAPEPSPDRRGRVLVVDDEPLVGRAIARLLSPPHEVVTRASARDAAELLREDPRFDVVLCDLMMPGMTGMDLHASLQESAPDVAARMVFLTGGAFTEAARAFLDRVPNACLAKPVDKGSLRDVVAQAVRAASPAA